MIEQTKNLFRVVLFEHERGFGRRPIYLESSTYEKAVETYNAEVLNFMQEAVRELTLSGVPDTYIKPSHIEACGPTGVWHSIPIKDTEIK